MLRLVQDMYESSMTGVVRLRKAEVGLHQGSDLSPFLMAMVKDGLTDKVSQESQWILMFADDIVICCESQEQVERNWRGRGVGGGRVKV